MTPTDRRALDLLSRNGRAVAVPYRGYWLCGGYRIAQVTVRRLVEAGWAYHEGPRAIRSTQAAPANDGEVAPDGPVEDLRWEEPTLAAPTVDGDDAPWAPPDWSLDDGRPVPVDEAFDDER